MNIFICGLILRDESWSIKRVLIKDTSRVLKYLWLKHDFSFIDQSNGWTLPNGNLDLSLFVRDSLLLIEEGNLKLAKLIINSIALTNNTGKRYSYNNICKNKASVSFALTLNEADFLPLSPPIHVLK